MIHGCVTLDEVFAAAGVRAASLVPETSGYLALAVGDATSRLPYAVDDRVVTLTTEGAVGIARRGPLVHPHRAAENLRGILARLLAVSTGSAMPGLSAAARPRHESERGVESVIEEIEAALIPVNRGAARRALARLARETIKARDSGHILPRPPARPARAPEPPARRGPPPPRPRRPRPAPRPAPPPRPRRLRRPAPVYATPAPAHAAPVYATPAPVYAPPIHATPVVAVAPPPAPPPLRAVVTMGQVSGPPPPADLRHAGRRGLVVGAPVRARGDALAPAHRAAAAARAAPRDHTPTVLGIGAVVAIRRCVTLDPGTVLAASAGYVAAPISVPCSPRARWT